MWYAAHLVMLVRFKDVPQERFPVWENVILLSAPSEEEAFRKAKERARRDEGDSDGSFTWDGQKARWEFVGVRKLISCEDGDEAPQDGAEVSFMQFELGSEGDVERLASGESVRLSYEE